MYYVPNNNISREQNSLNILVRGLMSNVKKINNNVPLNFTSPDLVICTTPIGK